MELAKTCIVALFPDHTSAIVEDTWKSFTAGTVFLVRRVDVEPPGKMKVDGKMTRIPKGTLRLWGKEGARSALVQASAVKIYFGQVPDWRMEFSLVEHGFQCDVYEGIQPKISHCRDFGGNHSIPKLVEKLTAKHETFMRAFRKGL